MKDEITVDGVRYKRVEDKYPRKFEGSYFHFEVLNEGTLRIYSNCGEEEIANLTDSLPALREALKYMRE